MVYFIKSTYSFGRNASKIAKTMINIEQNKHVFNADGQLINDPRPFNIYTCNNVEYDISISSGIIKIYTDDIISPQMCVNLLITEFLSINYDMSRDVDMIKFYEHKNNNHITLSKPYSVLYGTTTNVVGTSYRKLVMQYNDIKKCKDNGSKFVWFISTYVNQQNLNIPELSSTIPQKEFLMQSVSTIIYDQINLFNVACDTKQLDYPCAIQYNILSQKRLIESVVTIGANFGLAYEIINCYTKLKISRKNFLCHNPKLKFIDYNSVKIKRVDESKDWSVHIREPFDFESQEKLELQSEEIGKPAFPVDICFISRVPLYKHVYVVKVGLKNNTNQYTNITHILVSPSVYGSMIDDDVSSKSINFVKYFNNKTNYSIIDTYIAKFPRTEINAISLIPRDKISDERRNLLRCISLNGCLYYNDCFPKHLIAVDREKKLMYIGYKDIYDTLIVEYMNTNTILFAFHGI